jgi:gluconokinase
MITNLPPLVVMGVSGCGKSTIGALLGDRLGVPFFDGDDFHPLANKAKMAAGIPLDDDDRAPWLAEIGAALATPADGAGSRIIACSALKRSYRDLLRRGNDSVFFAHVDVPQAVLAERLANRTGHYMPPSLLDSQLATLEPLQDDEPGITVPGTGSADEVVDDVLAVLARQRGVPTPSA